MRLDQYISELLYEHECVIIPGFGGIVANYRPAFLNPAHHTFSPPSKRLAFNASLRTNDGLLASHLSKRLAVNYTEANSYITSFVNDCVKSLQDGRKLVLDKVGVLYLDPERNLQFMPDTSVNYLKSSYGFSALHSPAIRRDEPVTQPVVTEKKRRLVKLPKWRVIEVIPVAAMLAYLIINPTVVNTLNSQLASLNPFSKPIIVKLPQKEIDRKLDTSAYLDSNSVVIVSNEDVTNADSVIEVHSITDSPSIEKTEAPVINLKPNTITAEDVAAFNNKEVSSKEDAVDAKPDKTAVKKESVSNLSASGSRTYYIIGGSFSIEENATKFVESSKEAGFNATIAGKNPKGLIMVSLFSTTDASEAEQQLAVIKTKNPGGAWILKK